MNKYVYCGISILLLLVSCKKDTKVASSVYDIKVKHDPESERISYSISDSVDTVILQVNQKNDDQGILIYFYKGNTPLEKQAPKLAALFQAIFNDEYNFDFTTLVWGRMIDGLKQDYTLSKRLALFAKKSDQWDAKSGAPLSGTREDFIKKLKNDFSTELEAILKKYDYEIESLSAEKVLVGPAIRLLFWKDIETDADPGDILPFDCQLRFNLHKIQ